MKSMSKLITVFIFIVVLISLFGASLSVAHAKPAQIGTHTTIYLTARVQNKWWYAGNFQCKSAVLETLGFTYTGAIAHANWGGLVGNESCLITFSEVPYPLGVTPATVTVSYYTLAGDEVIDMVTEDRLQTQQKDYFLELTWYDDYVILDDMILEDTSTVPIIEYNPTALPPLPEVPGFPAP